MSDPVEATPALHLYVITGLSGSGISTAINALEDLGLFCVDNLPPPLVPKMVELAVSNPQTQKLVLGLDARSVTDSQASLDLLEGLVETHGHRMDIFFLEASDPVLLRRFSESRRPHPFARNQLPLPEAIRSERAAMHPFREVASLVLDTSDLNVHECKRRVQAAAGGEHHERLSVSVLSFGFRHGLPPEADIVWDVRFLPNPHFIEDLRPFSGLDARVSGYVLEQPATQEFLGGFLPLLESVIPRYEQEGKSYLTVAVGCTGGRHRSVAITERLADWLKAQGLKPTVRHRDIDKGKP